MRAAGGRIGDELMIIVLAGRRVDAAGAETPRFPLENVDAVAERIEKEFGRLGAAALVCSAACGADLVALKVARKLGMRRRIVLPFEAPVFRAKSVTDRPGNAAWDWGRLFDELYSEAEESGDVALVERGGKDGEADKGDETAAYKEANGRIFEEAKKLPDDAGEKASGGIAAVVVWEGAPRGEDDLTMEFAERARAAGFKLITVLTT